VRWKQAAESEGFRSVGAWLGGAADAYLKVRMKAGLPLPLAWQHGRFRVRLEDGTEPDVRGWVSPPFGIFHGSADGPIYHGSTHRYTLVYVPARRIVSTFRYAQHARALRAELAGIWARSGGEDGDTRAGPIVDRHVREAT
jgi:hypothetical protein